MTEICKYEVCTGCGACAAVCPVSAVSMREDGYAGIRPLIDQDKCIDCGRCQKVCPSLEMVDLKRPQMVYAAYSLSPECRSASASGGLASVLAESVISRGGVVYGCVQETAEDVSHKRIGNVSGIPLLRGSKYVQSYTAESYLSVRDDLKNQKTVLFIGTPCQVAGLKNLIGNDHQGLITADLCCHGVPSRSLLRDHLISMNLSPSECRVVFRRKDRGELEYGFGVENVKGGKLSWKPFYRDDYMTGFLTGLNFRENCFSCPYASVSRCGDVTLADFWGKNQGNNPEMTVNKGLSAVLVNTDAGRQLFETVSQFISYEERTIEDVVRSNERFCRPAVRPSSHAGFMKICRESGYQTACRRYIFKLKIKLFFSHLQSKYYKCPVRQFVRGLIKGRR